MPRGQTLEDRFWAKVDKSGEHWLWTGASSDGRNGFIQAHGKNQLAHRVAYELAYGPIPDGKAVVRLCEPPLCVRTEHYILRSHDAPLEVRFWERVKRADGCWFWQGGRDTNGYGVLNRGGRSDGKILAHRLSWLIANDDLPDDLDVLHHCDTPPCVNPEHLFLGTQADNNADRDAKGRQNLGEKNGAVRLKEGQVREIRRRYDHRDSRKSTRVWTNPDGIKAIAEDYGVHIVTIFDIVNRKTWVHVE